MGKLGRFACICTPFLLTLASLICLIIVGLGGTSPSNSTLSNLYFMRANTSAVHLNASEISLLGLPASISSQLDALIGDSSTGVFDATKALNLSDWYTVHLWNYCEGHDGTGNVTNAPTACSPRQRMFWFNPVEVWKLNSTGAGAGVNASTIISPAALHTYHTASKWMFITYCVAIIATATELIVGLSALFSRVGSLATTLVSVVASVFVLAFGVAASVIYSTLLGAFDGALRQYNIRAELGAGMFATVWLAVLFSWAGGLFWLVSVCCCSGRSSSPAKRREGRDEEAPRVQRGNPYLYQRVESPVGTKGQGQAVPMKDFGGRREAGTAYEPFRYQGR